VTLGDGQDRAVAKLQRAGFRCRQLARHEYGTARLDPIKVFNCHTSADRTVDGYTLVYATMTINQAGRLVEIHADSYPVLFRNLRKDAQGRIIVVQEVRPAVASDNLQGRWIIASVNGRKVHGLWIELGGEGPASVTRRADGGLNVGAPQPRSRAYLGCNYWHPNGWTRNGDKLTFGREMSSRSEIGCDADTVALDDDAYAILSRTMTMEFIPPDRLRLFNESGTLELVRSGG
jgi:hypothetical protein